MEALAVAFVTGAVALLIEYSKKKDKKMKQETYDLNKAQRKAQDNFEGVLVRLESIYGSEDGAPFVDTVIDHERMEVTFNGEPVTTKAQMERAVAQAEKEMEELIPTSVRIPNMSVKIISDKTTNFTLEFYLEDQLVYTSVSNAENIPNELTAAENHVLENMQMYYKFIDQGITFAEAVETVKAKRAYLKEAHAAYAHNAEAKRTFEATGVVVQRDETKYPYGGIGEINTHINHADNQIRTWKGMAKKFGYEFKAIMEGATYTKDIGRKTGEVISHPQRTAALRLNKVLTDEITFQVVGKEGERRNSYRITFADGSEALAILNICRKDKRNFYVNTFWPLDEQEYFDVHEVEDSLNKDDPDATAETLIALNLWKDR